jgi:predicted MFS family arabinose efflux permease
MVLFPALFGLVAVLGETGAPIAAIAVAAAAAGLTFAPVSSALRSIWPTVVGADGAKTAYALDAALQEVVFVGGPLLVAILALIGPVAAVAGAAIIAAAGTYGFSRLAPVRSALPAEQRHSSRLGALSAVGVRTIALLSLCLGLGFGAVEIAVPAFAETEGNRALAGIALAGFSAGSLVGGLLAALRPSSDERRRIIVGTFALAAIMALPLAARSIGSMALLLFLAGLPIAPVVAALYAQISRVAAAGSVAEAFSWFGTAVSIGIAGGSVAGGWLIDSNGWRAAVLLGVGCLCAGALLTALRRATLAPPEVRGLPAAE